MTDKSAYFKRFKELYEQKNHCSISDAEALELFENLVLLVSAITPKSFIEQHGCKTFRL